MDDHVVSGVTDPGQGIVNVIFFSVVRDSGGGVLIWRRRQIEVSIGEWKEGRKEGSKEGNKLRPQNETEMRQTEQWCTVPLWQKRKGSFNYTTQRMSPPGPLGNHGAGRNLTNEMRTQCEHCG